MNKQLYASLDSTVSKLDKTVDKAISQLAFIENNKNIENASIEIHKDENGCSFMVLVDHSTNEKNIIEVDEFGKILSKVPYQ